MGGIPESAALCLPAPTLQRPVPAVTALAGPRGLRAPSTRAQQRFLQVLLSSTPRGTTMLLLQLFQLLVLLSSPCCSPAVLPSPGPAAGWHCHIRMLRWLQVLVHVPGCAGITHHRRASPVVPNFLSGYPKVACSIEAPQCATVPVRSSDRGKPWLRGPRAALLFIRQASKGCSAHGTSPATQH